MTAVINNQEQEEDPHHKIIAKNEKGAMKGMDINIADWFVGGLYIVFLAGVILYAYYEVRMRK